MEGGGGPGGGRGREKVLEKPGLGCVVRALRKLGGMGAQPCLVGEGERRCGVPGLRRVEIQAKKNEDNKKNHPSEGINVPQ